MRVLVVEDEKKTASFVRKALEGEGFAVDVCHRGDDALVAAMATPFDGIGRRERAAPVACTK
jgi:DNA-binding response OmpR family regulator